MHARRHDLKFGGEVTFGSHQLDAHVLEFGLFRFTTDLPFDPAVQSTWPRSFEQQAPTQVTYRSRELALFAQDDWRIASRVRVNAGVRYDLDFNLRINDFSADLLDDPGMAGLDQFISRDRGTDTNNVQPRLGATWDATGSGRVIVRGGAGLYVTRNRPWYQLRAMNQAVSGVVRITDARLRNFPDIAAVLGSCVAGSFSTACGPKQLGTVIPDDFVQPYAVNTTGGVGWQITSTAALDVDYVHSYGAHQVGSTDRNLPPAGLLANTPRPVPAFSQIVMLENFSRSWYDALEAQLRGRIGVSRLSGVLHPLAELPRWCGLLPRAARYAANAARARLQPERPAAQPRRRRPGTALGDGPERHRQAGERIAGEGAGRRGSRRR